MINEKNKKISLFLPSLRGGGAERVMATLAGEFASKNHSVDLVLAKKEGPYLEEVSNSVNIVDLNTPRIAVALFSLASYLRRAKPDVLLSTLTHANIIAVAAKIISASSTKIVLREANTLSLNLSKHKGISARIMPLLVKIFYPLSDGILAVSKSVAIDTIREARVPDKKLSVVYNPVITKTMLLKSQEDLNHPWFTKPPCPVILGVGRLAHEKGFDILINAITMVRERTPVKLLILGEGNARTHLESIVKQNHLEDDVYMPGYVANPFPYMKSSDLFVLSSRWEGLPNSLIQAMALGTKVISTNCPGGSNEILESGRWGTLVDVDNIEEMAEAITSALQKGAVNNTQETINYCLSKFSAESIAKQYLEIILGHE